MRIRTSPFSLLRHPLFKPSARPFLLRRGFTTPSTPSSRLNKLNTRLPRFLQKYTTPLLNAPITHITSFLILHEITAIVPLLGLAGIFHYTEWLPPFFAEGKWIKEGVERFGKYFRRKGWLGKIEEGEIEGVKADLDKDGGRIGSRPRRDVWWGRGEGGVRVVVE